MCVGVFHSATISLLCLFVIAKIQQGDGLGAAKAFQPSQTMQSPPYQLIYVSNVALKMFAEKITLKTILLLSRPVPDEILKMSSAKSVSVTSSREQVIENVACSHSSIKIHNYSVLVPNQHGAV